MFLMQQNHSFCDVAWTSKHDARSYKSRFLHGFTSFFRHGAVIAVKNPCWHSLSAFHNHPAARRYVRSTWNSTKMAPSLRDAPAQEPSYVRCLLKMASWRAPDSILDPPASIFTPPATILDPLGMLFWIGIALINCLPQHHWTLHFQSLNINAWIPTDAAVSA